MATKTQESISTAPQRMESKGDVAVFQPARFPYHDAIGERFGVDKGMWKVLTDAIFPAAQTPDAIVLAMSYCRSRKLDIMKRPVHIVPMYDSKKRAYVETVWPSISELRTTATRTGEYAGCDEAEFGPYETVTFTGRIKQWSDEANKMAWVDASKEVTFPLWCRITVYRIIKGVKCKFVGPKTLWRESYATVGGSDIPNEMWESRSEGQLEKCAEAAALRRAFPEEIGNELSAEEMAGRRVEELKDVEVATEPKDAAPPRPTPTSATPEQDRTGHLQGGDRPNTEQAAPKADAKPPRKAAAAPAGEAKTQAAVQQQAEPAKTPDDPPLTHDELTGGGSGPDDMDADHAADLADGEEQGSDLFADETAPAPEAPPEPNFISTEGLNTGGWTQKYLDALRTSQTAKAVFGWIDKNQQVLGAMSVKNPPKSAEIKAATEKLLNDLRKSPEAVSAPPAEQKTDAAPPRRRAAAKPKEADIPGIDPKDETPESILTWADAIMSRIEDPDQLALVWRDRIEPYLAKLLKPDQDELQGMLKAHEGRMQP